MDIASKIQLQKDMLKRIDQQISLLNQKSAILLAALGLIVGFLLNYSPGDNAPLVIYIIEILAFLNATLTAIILLSIVYPFLKSGGPIESKASVIYFGRIAEREAHEYVVSVQELDDIGLLSDLSAQIHGLSKSLMHRFRLSRIAIILLGLLFVEITALFVTEVIYG